MGSSLANWPVRGVVGRPRVDAVPDGPMPLPQPGLKALTAKQRQVALLLLEGYQPFQIARLLEISRSAVKKRLEPIYDSFGVHNAMQFVCQYFNERSRLHYQQQHRRAARDYQKRHQRKGLCERCSNPLRKSKQFCDMCLKNRNAQVRMRTYHSSLEALP